MLKLISIDNGLNGAPLYHRHLWTAKNVRKNVFSLRRRGKETERRKSKESYQKGEFSEEERTTPIATNTLTDPD